MPSPYQRSYSPVFWSVLIVYAIGFVFTMWLHAHLPVTFSLAISRAILWPIYLPSGWPHGTPLTMD